MDPASPPKPASSMSRETTQRNRRIMSLVDLVLTPSRRESAVLKKTKVGRPLSVQRASTTSNATNLSWAPSSPTCPKPPSAHANDCSAFYSQLSSRPRSQRSTIALPPTASLVINHFAPDTVVEDSSISHSHKRDSFGGRNISSNAGGLVGSLSVPRPTASCVGGGNRRSFSSQSCSQSSTISPTALSPSTPDTPSESATVFLGPPESPDMSYVPVLPLKSVLRQSRNFSAPLAKIDTGLTQSSATISTHNVYMSSEEDVSSDTGEFDSDDDRNLDREVLGLPPIRDPQLRAIPEREVSPQTTARAVAVVFSGKPSVVNIANPRRTCSVSTITTSIVTTLSSDNESLATSASSLPTDISPTQLMPTPSVKPGASPTKGTRSATITEAPTLTPIELPKPTKPQRPATLMRPIATPLPTFLDSDPFPSPMTARSFQGSSRRAFELDAGHTLRRPKTATSQCSQESTASPTDQESPSIRPKTPTKLRGAVIRTIGLVKQRSRPLLRNFAQHLMHEPMTPPTSMPTILMPQSVLNTLPMEPSPTSNPCGTPAASFDAVPAVSLATRSSSSSSTSLAVGYNNSVRQHLRDGSIASHFSHQSIVSTSSGSAPSSNGPETPSSATTPNRSVEHYSNTYSSSTSDQAAVVMSPLLSLTDKLPVKESAGSDYGLPPHRQCQSPVEFVPEITCNQSLLTTSATSVSSSSLSPQQTTPNDCSVTRGVSSCDTSHGGSYSDEARDYHDFTSTLRSFSNTKSSMSKNKRFSVMLMTSPNFSALSSSTSQPPPPLTPQPHMQRHRDTYSGSYYTASGRSEPSDLTSLAPTASSTSTSGNSPQSSPSHTMKGFLAKAKRGSMHVKDVVY